MLLQGTPDGEALTAVVHDQDGPVMSIQVYREDLEDGISDNAYLLNVPEPSGNWQAIEVPGLLPPQAF